MSDAYINNKDNTIYIMAGTYTITDTKTGAVISKDVAFGGHKQRQEAQLRDRASQVLASQGGKYIQKSSEEVKGSIQERQAREYQASQNPALQPRTITQTVQENVYSQPQQIQQTERAKVEQTQQKQVSVLLQQGLMSQRQEVTNFNRMIKNETPMQRLETTPSGQKYFTSAPQQVLTSPKQEEKTKTNIFNLVLPGINNKESNVFKSIKEDLLTIGSDVKEKIKAKDYTVLLPLSPSGLEPAGKSFLTITTSPISKSLEKLGSSLESVTYEKQRQSAQGNVLATPLAVGSGIASSGAYALSSFLPNVQGSKSAVSEVVAGDKTALGNPKLFGEFVGTVATSAPAISFAGNVEKATAVSTFQQTATSAGSRVGVIAGTEGKVLLQTTALGTRELKFKAISDQAFTINKEVSRGTGYSAVKVGETITTTPIKTDAYKLSDNLIFSETKSNNKLLSQSLTQTNSKGSKTATAIEGGQIYQTNLQVGQKQKVLLTTNELRIPEVTATPSTSTDLVIKDNLPSVNLSNPTNALEVKSAGSTTEFLYTEKTNNKIKDVNQILETTATESKVKLEFNNIERPESRIGFDNFKKIGIKTLTTPTIDTIKTIDINKGTVSYTPNTQSISLLDSQPQTMSVLSAEPMTLSTQSTALITTETTALTTTPSTSFSVTAPSVSQSINKGISLELLPSARGIAEQESIRLAIINYEKEKKGLSFGLSSLRTSNINNQQIVTSPLKTNLNNKINDVFNIKTEGYKDIQNFKTDKVKDEITKFKTDNVFKPTITDTILKKAQIRESTTITESITKYKPENITKTILDIKNPNLPNTSKFDSNFNKALDFDLPEKKKTSTESKAFKILLKKKGSLVDIGVVLPFGRAVALGKTETRGVLGRTFVLKEFGTTAISDIYKPTTEDYRQSRTKEGFFKFVEKNALISTREKYLIQQSKRISSSKNGGFKL